MKITLLRSNYSTIILPLRVGSGLSTKRASCPAKLVSTKKRTVVYSKFRSNCDEFFDEKFEREKGKTNGRIEATPDRSDGL